MISFLFKSFLSDEEAMVKFQKGDPSGFNTVLDRHNESLYRFLLRMMAGNSSQAEDLFQDVFLKVIEKKKDYNSKMSFKTWLFTIARNTAVDFLRKESYRNHLSLDEPIFTSDDFSNVSKLDLVKGKNSNPDQLIYKRELNYLLNEKLNKLSDEFKEVFILKEIEGLKFKDIAVITDSPLSTVKSRMRYALKKMKEEIEKTGFFENLNKVTEAL
ncbi:MAG: sigma-70 family RNA polymerase sigma factor [Thermodesulfobacteriota bacterium]